MYILEKCVDVRGKSVVGARCISGRILIDMYDAIWVARREDPYHHEELGLSLDR